MSKRLLASFEVRFNLPESRDHQMKGPLARPVIPFGGPKNRREKIVFHPDLSGCEMNVRLADLAATYSPAS